MPPEATNRGVVCRFASSRHRRRRQGTKVEPVYDPAVPDLGPAIDTILTRCLGVKAGEDVLVIADSGTRTIGEALREGARARGAESVLAEMDERATDGTEPPPVIAAAMMVADVVIAPTTRSLSHTTARKRATEAGVRAATLPGVTADMLARVMAIDFETMAARSHAVADLLSAQRSAHVSCPRGTDITLQLDDRSGGPDDGRLDFAGAFGNLPCGEAWIAPLGGSGQIVASSIARLGISNPPAVLTVRNGQLVDAHGGLGPRLLESLTAHGELGRNLAELGVGTNDRATLTGNLLEDEKILGTVHLAFGASAGLGGTVSVPIHLDVVVLDASLELGEVPVLDRGRWLLDVG
jgi:aminopeptidase